MLALLLRAVAGERLLCGFGSFTLSKDNEACSDAPFRCKSSFYCSRIQPGITWNQEGRQSNAGKN